MQALEACGQRPLRSPFECLRVDSTLGISIEYNIHSVFLCANLRVLCGKINHKGLHKEHQGVLKINNPIFG